MMETQARRFAADGIFHMRTGPVAVQMDGITFAGWVTRGGDTIVASYEAATGVLRQTVVYQHGVQDDHNVPAILIRRSDKRVMVFYTGHAETVMRWKISTNPLDISSFGAEKSFTAAGSIVYPQPIQLSAENDRIYLFFRNKASAKDRNWEFRTSDDNGESFGSQTVLRTPISNFSDGVRTAFVLPFSDGVSRVDFVASNYEWFTAGGVPNKIYHFYYEGGEFFKTDGTNIGELPITSDSQMTVVSPEDDVYCWGVARGSDGHPVVVWVKYADYDNNHEYWYGRWNGSAWVTSKIVDAGRSLTNVAPGRAWVSGGVAINLADPSEVYASIAGGPGQSSIWKLRTEDGLEWQRVLRIEGDSRKNFRPVSPLNADPDSIEVLFTGGAYRDFKQFGPSSILSYPGPRDERIHSLAPSFRGALVGMTAAQALPSGGGQAIVFGAIESDTDGFFVDGNFVIPEGVQVVRVKLSVRLDAAPTQAFVNIQKNNTFPPGSGYDWHYGARILKAETGPLFVKPGDQFKFTINPMESGRTIEAHGATWASIEVLE